MFGLGIGEIVIILFVALIFIGPKKLPELAKGLGKGFREFQNAANGLKETIQNPAPTQNQSQSLDQPLDQPEIVASSEATSAPIVEENSGENCEGEKFVANHGDEEIKNS